MQHTALVSKIKKMICINDNDCLKKNNQTYCMRFLATSRSLTSNNIPLELTKIDVIIDTNCLKEKNKLIV